MLERREIPLPVAEWDRRGRLAWWSCFAFLRGLVQSAAVNTIVVRDAPPTLTMVVAGRDLNQPGIVITDDCVEWRAEWVPWVGNRLASMGFITPNWREVTGGARLIKGVDLDIKAKTLLAWAKKQNLSRERQLASEGSKSLSEKKIKYAECPEIGAVRYDDWGSVSKKSAHSFDEVHRQVVADVLECAKAWKWLPTGLTISFHSSGRAAGLAYEPGNGNRRISIRRDILEKYDIKSLSRLVLHELCHHAREELHPRRLITTENAHDERFCEMLRMVDSVVAAEPMSCRYFTDDADGEAVAASAAKSGKVFSSEAGEIVIGIAPDGKYRYRWDPVGTYKWSSKWERFVPCEFVTFVKQFPGSDRKLIPVKLDLPRLPKSLVERLSVSASPGSCTALPTVADLIDYMARMYPSARNLKEAFQ